jgi:hypothetical protein
MEARLAAAVNELLSLMPDDVDTHPAIVRAREALYAWRERERDSWRRDVERLTREANDTPVTW